MSEKLGLEVIASANVSQLEKGLNDAKKALASTAIQAQKMDSALASTAKGSSRAALALTDVGRVAQDLPFGFIGIQNNLNPLLESFQRLKAETGSSSSALKALGSSLIGAGGIGFALSVVSSAILIFQNGIAGFNKKSKEAKEANDEFAKSLDSVRAKATASGLSLQGYVNIAKDQTQSLETRNNALREANKIMGEHGEKLTLLNIATKGVTEEINKFTQATIQQALASKLSDRVADLLIKQANASRTYGKELAKLKELQKLPQTTISATGEERVTEAYGKTATQLKKVITIASEYKSITQDIYSVSNDLTSSQLKASQLFGELGTKSKDKTEKALKDIRTIQDVLKDLSAQVKFNNEKSDLLGTEKAKANLKALQAAFDEALKDFNTKANRPIILKLAFQIEKTEAAIAGEELTARIREGLKANVPKLTTVKPKLVIRPDVEFEDKELIAELLSIAEFTTATIRSMFTDAFVGIGDAIGNAIAGQGNLFGGVFSAMFKALGAGLRQLGAFAITSSKAILALKETIGKKAGIVGGIAMIALGTLISAAAAKIKAPAFATGVRDFAGGLALVGERGPEYVNLPKGAGVTPNNQLNAYGGGGISLQPSIHYEGTGFRIMLNRVDAANRRNN